MKLTPSNLRESSFYTSYQESVLGKINTSFIKHNNFDRAAALTYYLLFSCIPLLLLALSLTHLVGVGVLQEHVIPQIMTKLPPALQEVLKQPLASFLSTQGASTTFIFSIIFTLLPASKYVAGMGRALDTIQETKSTSLFIRTKIRMLLTTILLLLVMVIGALIMLATSSLAVYIAEAFSLDPQVISLISQVRWPLMAAFVILMMVVLYVLTPQSFAFSRAYFSRSFVPGAVAAFVLLVVATWGFHMYVTHINNYSSAYGVLSGFVLMILWFFILNVTVLYGAECNSYLTRSRTTKKS